MQDEGVGRGELARIAGPVVDEGQFAQILAAAVEPEVEAEGLGRVGGPRRRHHQAVGLDGVVDARAVPAHHQAGLAGPGGGSAAQGRYPFGGHLQLQAGGIDLIGPEEFIIPQRPIHGLVVNLHIRQPGQQRGLLRELALQRFQVGTQLGDALSQFIAGGFGNRDARRRHPANLIRPVVGRPIRQRGNQRHTEKQGERNKGGAFHGKGTP